MLTPGLCATCQHAKVLSSDRGSSFYRCGLSDTDPRFRRYPALPILRCDGYLASAQQPQATATPTS